MLSIVFSEMPLFSSALQMVVLSAEVLEAVGRSGIERGILNPMVLIQAISLAFSPAFIASASNNKTAAVKINDNAEPNG